MPQSSKYWNYKQVYHAHLKYLFLTRMGYRILSGKFLFGFEIESLVVHFGLELTV